VGKIGQNLKYDLQILRRWGVDLRGIRGDTLVASYLLDPGATHNLDALALRHLGHTNISYQDVTGTGKKQISFAGVPIDRATAYSGEDADVAFRLHGAFAPQIEEQGLGALYRDVEIPLIEVLADMEFVGVLVDSDALDVMDAELREEMGKIELGIYALAGGPFNISSPKQLQEILFTKLGLPVGKKTKTGHSTDESVLLDLAASHPICSEILKYRELAKLRSTYVEGLIVEIHPRTGRVHTSYNQTITATGRLSSSSPNLQNIPVDRDRHDIRSVFRCPPGTRLLSADYSQVELRILAHMSRDPVLKRAFEEGRDVHDETARLVFGVSDVTPEQRKVAKTINFGVVYGQTAYGLSQQLKIGPARAKEFIDEYFRRYPAIQAFLRGLVEGCRRDGYVTTLLGRRRNFPEINSGNRMVREMAERAAINAPLQGTAADLIKVAMVRLHRRLADEALKSRMILQVHDELVLEVPEAESERVESLVRELMQGAMTLSVPLRVDLGWGKTWKECAG